MKESLTAKVIGQPKESKLVQLLIPTFKQKRTQQFTTLALTFITLAFFGLFAINPTLGTISDLQKQLDDNTFVNSSMQTKIANLTTLQQKYTLLQPNLQSVYAAIPASVALDSFVGQIHAVASLTNVQINSMQTYPVDISLQTFTIKYASYEFTVEITGDYPSVEKFLTTLDSLNRLLIFDTISINNVGKVTNTYHMSIRGKTFFKGDTL